jgi:hypothetical protein
VPDFVSSNDDCSKLPEEFEGAKDGQKHEGDYPKFIQFGIRMLGALFTPRFSPY